MSVTDLVRSKKRIWIFFLFQFARIGFPDLSNHRHLFSFFVLNILECCSVRYKSIQKFALILQTDKHERVLKCQNRTGLSFLLSSYH